MADFVARSVEFTGRFTVPGTIDTVFDLFSPLGERAWVPDWDPEFLYPSGVVWACGQIFRTQEETGEAVWIVTRLNCEAHQVEYHRVEPRRYVARIRVTCTTSQGDRGTEVCPAYAFVGLSSQGNHEIEAMTNRSYAEKMRRWERWISEYLTHSAPTSM